jgi:lactoylglutathione lyase
LRDQLQESRVRRQRAARTFLDFLNPWDNRFEIVGYDNIQFSKAPNVLRGMGSMHLSKSAQAIKELAEKGMAPD